MTTSTPQTSGTQGGNAWNAFERELPALRGSVRRMLFAILSYDARRADSLPVDDLPDAILDEAVAHLDRNRKSLPSGASPALWLRKMSLTLLEERLDQEALAGGGLYHSWTGVRGALLALGLDREPGERERWLAIHARVRDEAHLHVPRESDEPHPGETRSERDRLRDLERAVLRQPEHRRRILMHHYFDGLDHEAIAFLLDATVDEVEEDLASAQRGFWLELAPRA